MSFAPVANKELVAQGAGAQLSTSAVLAGGYVAGEVIRCWVKHRSTITPFTGVGTGWYLCDNADANRVPLTLGPQSQPDQAGDKLSFGYVQVPSGVTYTTVKVNLIAGATANWLSTKTFTASAALQSRDTNGDSRPAPIAGAQNIQVSLDVAANLTGGGCLVCAAVATNAQSPGAAATNGFIVGTQPSAPRGLAADKALNSAPGPAGAAATTLSWTSTTQESAMLVTIQETAATTFVGIGAHLFGHMNFVFKPTVVSTTVGIDTGFAMVFQPDFHVNVKNVNGNPTLLTIIPTAPATRRASAPPIAQIDNNIVVFSTPPATRRSSAPPITVKDLIPTTIATRRASAPAGSVIDIIATKPATRHAVAPLIVVVDTTGVQDFSWQPGKARSGTQPGRPKSQWRGGVRKP